MNTIMEEVLAWCVKGVRIMFISQMVGLANLRELVSVGGSERQ